MWLLAGAVAGFAATLPMTLAMLALHRRLPWHERYALPPRQITLRLAERFGLRRKMGEPARSGATLAAHFGYGALMGAAYAPLAKGLPVPRAASGVGFGLAAWAGSYFGWLPAAGLLSPPTDHPGRRNALMIAAHLLWGAAAGLLLDLAEDAAREAADEGQAPRYRTGR
jgi:uncharacterized membrane protein YagU involved in acid resistance